MYQTAYADILEAGAQATRHREREALERSISLLRDARSIGFRTPRGAEAIFYTNRVWSFMVEDLSLADNDLPDAVRANLISLGIYVIRQLDNIRAGNEAAADDIIELTGIIKDGLT
jgi:flagellar biosynthesis activator protein FlaF